MKVKDYELTSKDELTLAIKDRSIYTWVRLLEYVRNIPYGRNESRTDFKEVILNHRGTCSTKHALLKSVAVSNLIPHVRLILGMYKMTLANTPGIGDHLAQNKLKYIPEAHCYLSIQGNRIDLTNSSADIDRICEGILEEIEIEPIQVGQYKVDYHKSYMNKWRMGNADHLTFEALWNIREACIRSLVEA